MLRGDLIYDLEEGILTIHHHVMVLGKEAG